VDAARGACPADESTGAYPATDRLRVDGR
jgi:hypothetical protein